MPALIGTRRALLSGRKAAAAAFVPTDIAGLQLWLKADAGLYQDAAMTTLAVADADPVGGWADQSGLGNHATQATADSRPILKLAIQNGKPVVRFDGTDDLLLVAGMTPSQPWTIAIVLNCISGSYPIIFGGSNNGILGDSGRYAYNVGNVQTYRSGTLFGTGCHLVEYVQPTANADHALGYIDGVLSLAAAGGGGWNGASTRLAGSCFGADLPEVDYSEVLYYNSALSTANRQAVESYLNARWGVY